MKQTRRAQCGCAGLAASALVVAAILAGTWTAAPALGAVRDVLVAAEHRAEAIGDRFQRTWARYTIGQAWQRIDSAHAAELADRLESWTAKRDLLTEVMFAWGQIDPQAAGHWGIEFQARTPGDLVRRNTALHYAVVGMVTKNPKLADELIWKHLGEEGWGGKLRTAPMAAAIELAKVDPPAALAMAEKIYSGTKAGANSADAKRTGEVKPLGTGAAYPAIARQLAKHDATQAVGLVSATKSLVLKSHIVYEVAVEVAARDPAAAGELIEKWAGVVDYYTYRAGAAAVVAEAWARQSPERAAVWAEKLAPEHDRAAALRGAAHGWGQRSTVEALAWAAAIRNPQDAVPALVGVAEAELPHPL